MDDSSLLMITSNLLEQTARLPAIWPDGSRRPTGNCASSARRTRAVPVAAGSPTRFTITKLWDARPAAILAEAGCVEPICAADKSSLRLVNYRGAKVPSCR